METVDETLKERQSVHGDFSENSRISQGLKKVLKTGKNWEALPDMHKEALEMVVHKIGRWLSGDFLYDDNSKDVAGYAMLVFKELQKIK